MDISRFFGFIVNYIIVYFNDPSLSKVSSAAPRDFREWKAIK